MSVLLCVTKPRVLLPVLAVLILTLGLPQQAAAEAAETAVDNLSAGKGRIVVRLKVRSIDLRSLALNVSFFNPYRCEWAGHLFLEREDLSGSVFTVARGYHVTIPGGTRLVGTIIVRRPPPSDINLFVARAYSPNGEDQESYVSIIPDDDPSDEYPPPDQDAEQFVLGDDVLYGTFDRTARDDGVGLRGQPPCDDNLGPDRGPIQVELSLEPDGRFVDVTSFFRNVDSRPWRGDLYVDVTPADGRIRIARRDPGVRIPPGLGFSTWDRVWIEHPGVYRFTARALHRDGSHVVRWLRRCCPTARQRQPESGLAM